jgi:hypothetical protein
MYSPNAKNLKSVLEKYSKVQFPEYTEAQIESMIRISSQPRDKSFDKDSNKYYSKYFAKHFRRLKLILDNYDEDMFIEPKKHEF